MDLLTLTLARIIPQRDVKSTIFLLLLLLIVGSVLIWQMIKMRKELEGKACPYVKGLNTTILVMSIVMVAIPLIVLVLNIAGFKIGSIKILALFENVIRAQAIVAAYSLILVALIYILYIKLKDCQLQVELATWIASGILLVGTFSLLIIRFHEDSKETRQVRDNFNQPEINYLDFLTSGLKKGASKVSRLVQRINPFS
jgi:uncharacterized Tic20 family protein